jgi:fructokinase
VGQAPQVYCLGEVLWDSLPAGLFLGGAPLNVACHLQALGVRAGMISRVGDDRLGSEAIRRIASHGVSTDLIQLDPSLPTGFVAVTLDARGTPTYDIVAPAAWDAVELAEGVLETMAGAQAMVYGSLAQRAPATRATIERLLEAEVLRVFDVNLRAPYHDPEVVRRSLERARLVKLNEQELGLMAEWFDLPEALEERVAALAERFDCEAVCVTRGPHGAALLRDGRWTEHAGYEVEVADTVGAGDAFLASLLAGLLAGRDDETLLREANRMGAYVASQAGAVPAYHPERAALPRRR